MKDLDVNLFNEFNKLPTLLRYFYLKPDNYVIVDTNIPEIKFKFYVDDEGSFHKYNIHMETDYLYQPTLHDLLCIIEQTESQDPDDKSNGFKSKWEEIQVYASMYISRGLI